MRVTTPAANYTVFEPEYIHGEGFYKREKALVNLDVMPSGFKLGVISGRAHAEARLGLRHAKLLNRIPDTNWITPESGAKKPDGRTLALAREAMDFKFALYIGDIMDDLNTVTNYRDLRSSGKARVASAIVLSGPSGDKHKREFLEAGADIVAPDVNFLLEYLKKFTQVIRVFAGYLEMDQKEFFAQGFYHP